MTKPGVITNENRQVGRRSYIPNVVWGTEHMSDEEQDIIRYVGDIIEDGNRMLKRIESEQPISKAMWKEWISYIRAVRVLIEKMEEENLTN